MHEKDTEPWDPNLHGSSQSNNQNNNAPLEKSKLDIAAKAVWVVSAVEIVIFGFYAIVTAILGSMPAEKLKSMGTQAKLDPDQLQSLLDHQNDLILLAIFLFITMIVPAIVLIFFGFKVRNGNLTGNKIARVLIYIQCFILGVELLWQVLSGAGAGMIVGIIIFGGMLGLLITTSQKLIAARDQIINSGDDR